MGLTHIFALSHNFNTIFLYYNQDTICYLPAKFFLWCIFLPYFSLFSWSKVIFLCKLRQRQEMNYNLTHKSVVTLFHTGIVCRESFPLQMTFSQQGPTTKMHQVANRLCFSFNWTNFANCRLNLVEDKEDITNQRNCKTGLMQDNTNLRATLSKTYKVKWRVETNFNKQKLSFKSQVKHCSRQAQWLSYKSQAKQCSRQAQGLSYESQVKHCSRQAQGLSYKFQAKHCSRQSIWST